MTTTTQQAITNTLQLLKHRLQQRLPTKKVNAIIKTLLGLADGRPCKSISVLSDLEPDDWELLDILCALICKHNKECEEEAFGKSRKDKIISLAIFVCDGSFDKKPITSAKPNSHRRKLLAKLAEVNKKYQKKLSGAGVHFHVGIGGSSYDDPLETLSHHVQKEDYVCEQNRAFHWLLPIGSYTSLLPLLCTAPKNSLNSTLMSGYDTSNRAWLIKALTELVKKLQQSDGTATHAEYKLKIYLQKMLARFITIIEINDEKEEKKGKSTKQGTTGTDLWGSMKSFFVQKKNEGVSNGAELLKALCQQKYPTTSLYIFFSHVVQHLQDHIGLRYVAHERSKLLGFNALLSALLAPKSFLLLTKFFKGTSAGTRQLEILKNGKKQLLVKYAAVLKIALHYAYRFVLRNDTMATLKSFASKKQNLASDLKNFIMAIRGICRIYQVAQPLALNLEKKWDNLDPSWRQADYAIFLQYLKDIAHFFEIYLDPWAKHETLQKTLTPSSGEHAAPVVGLLNIALLEKRAALAKTTSNAKEALRIKDLITAIDTILRTKKSIPKKLQKNIMRIATSAQTWQSLNTQLNTLLQQLKVSVKGPGFIYYAYHTYHQESILNNLSAGSKSSSNIRRPKHSNAISSGENVNIQRLKLSTVLKELTPVRKIAEEKIKEGLTLHKVQQIVGPNVLLLPHSLIADQITALLINCHLNKNHPEIKKLSFVLSVLLSSVEPSRNDFLEQGRYHTAYRPSETTLSCDIDVVRFVTGKSEALLTERMTVEETILAQSIIKLFWNQIEEYNKLAWLQLGYIKVEQIVNELLKEKTGHHSPGNAKKTDQKSDKKTLVNYLGRWAHPGGLGIFLDLDEIHQVIQSHLSKKPDPTTTVTPLSKKSVPPAREPILMHPNPPVSLISRSTAAMSGSSSSASTSSSSASASSSSTSGSTLSASSIPPPHNL